MTERYRFKCLVIDNETDTLVISDHTYISEIDQFGACESVDMTVARMMRQFKQLERKEREKAL